MRLQLVEAAAQVLATEGRAAVTARRLATEVGASTQVLYTHFDGIDEVVAEIWREGFARFGEALNEPAVTDDPVADWMAQGWGYRRFALRNRHLYVVMFGDEVAAFRVGQARDLEAATATFGSLLDRIDRCVAAGRWEVDDVTTAGEVVWAVSHGQLSIELVGYFDGVGRDPEVTFTECLRRVALGFGDSSDLVEASLGRAARRARRADAA